MIGFGLAAVIASGLAFVFHGFGLNHGPWINWQSMLCLGVALLAVYLLTGGECTNLWRVRRQRAQAPPS